MCFCELVATPKLTKPSRKLAIETERKSFLWSPKPEGDLFHFSNITDHHSDVAQASLAFTSPKAIVLAFLMCLREPECAISFFVVMCFRMPEGA